MNPDVSTVLEITSNVDDSKVYVGNVYRGDASIGDSFILNNMPPGNYEIKVTKEGYIPYSGIASITKGETTTFETNLLPTNTGTLEVTAIVGTTPTDANIILDDINQNTPTPHSFVLDIGEHNVTVNKTGYIAPLEIFTISNGQTTSIEVQLTPISQGYLYIDSTPQNCAIYINNEETPSAFTAHNYLLNTEQYTVKVQCNINVATKQDVQVYENLQTNVFCTLNGVTNDCVIVST